MKGIVDIYSKYLFPRLIDFTMRNKETARLRRESLTHAYGNVLEIGIGSGLNLPFYPSEVTSVHGIDPSPELLRMARRQAASVPFKVEFLAQSAEQILPLPEASIDTAVITWTLCSIPDAGAALEQVKRVLKPSGHLLFVEHGRSDNDRIVAWQDRLTPIWKHIGGGCHLNRKIDGIVTSAGFKIQDLKTFYLPGPRPMTYTYQGTALPRT
jgi:ubiquinone/menaquinone biosynthesis C-methylase UbiE